MSDLSENAGGKKKAYKFGNSLSSPGSFGAFGGLFILQGIITLVWGITKDLLDRKPETFEQLTGISTQSTAQMTICIYGLICIIGGILMLGMENITEILKPSGRKPTVKGWISSIAGAAFISAIILLPFFIIFNLISH